MLLNKLNSLHNSQTYLGVLTIRTLRRQAPPPGKPPILPPSKKILYNVVHPEWTKPEHVKELLWRRHVYNNAMESLRVVFAQEIKQKEQEGLTIESLRKQELEELDLLIAANEKRNREATEQRKIQEAHDMEELKRQITEEIEQNLEQEHEFIQQRADEVKEAITRSGQFVTLQNLDQRLNEILETPVVFDYAMDLNGAKFYDPPPVKYQTGVPTRQKARLYDRTLMGNSSQSSS